MHLGDIQTEICTLSSIMKCRPLLCPVCSLCLLGVGLVIMIISIKRKLLNRLEIEHFLLDRVETRPGCGALIAGYKGDRNMSALVCNVFRDNQQTTTVWSAGTATSRGIIPLSQSSGSLSVSNNIYASKLSILALTSDLDNLVVYCGTEEKPELANFTLRIYSKNFSDL